MKKNREYRKNTEINAVENEINNYVYFYEDNYYIVGDIHGNYNSFVSLIERNGFRINENGNLQHGENAKIIVLGDFIDRGPDSLKLIQCFMKWTKEKQAIVLKGNHEVKISKILSPDTNILIDNSRLCVYGSQFVTLKQLVNLPSNYIIQIKEWIDALPVVIYNDTYIMSHAFIITDDFEYLTVSDFIYGSKNVNKDTIGIDSLYKGKRILIHGHFNNGNNKFEITKNKKVYNLDCNDASIKLLHIKQNQIIEKDKEEFDMSNYILKYPQNSDYYKLKKYIKDNNKEANKEKLKIISDNRFIVFISSTMNKMYDKTSIEYVYDSWTGKFLNDEEWMFLLTSIL